MRITLSGADEGTSIFDLHRLADRGAEIGILYTFSPDNRKRYPSLQWIAEVAACLKNQMALHVCGSRARDELHSRRLDPILKMVGRVQVNGVLAPAEVIQICSRYPTLQIVTQHFPENLWLLPVESSNHAILVDGSGGRGISPERWERPKTGKPIGFAGGLGPDNLTEELPKIVAADWIDMEGKLRDANDSFSVEKANAVMSIFESASRHGVAAAVAPQDASHNQPT